MGETGHLYIYFSSVILYIESCNVLLLLLPAGFTRHTPVDVSKAPILKAHDFLNSECW